MTLVYFAFFKPNVDFAYIIMLIRTIRSYIIMLIRTLRSYIIMLIRTLRSYIIMLIRTLGSDKCNVSFVLCSCFIFVTILTHYQLCVSYSGHGGLQPSASHEHYQLRVCVCVCVRACVGACVRACVRVCVLQWPWGATA